MSAICIHNLGYPRIGERRELKKATEAYWQGKLSAEELQQTAAAIRAHNWKKQHSAGLDLVPTGDFSFYDQVLDTTALFGNVPPRFGWQGSTVDLDTLFAIARGIRSTTSCTSNGHSDCPHHHNTTFASEMTKWFDTNYHYIVPEFHSATTFHVANDKPIQEFLEARQLGIPAKPVLIGPVTYLTLGKVHDPHNPDFDRFTLFDRLLPCYIHVLQKLAEAGATWVQIDEPILALDLSDTQRQLLRHAFEQYAQQVPQISILLATYFGPLRDNLTLATSLLCAGLHIDAVRAPEEVSAVAEQLPPHRVLSLGIVDGRNIWKNDYSRSLEIIRKVQAIRPDSPLWLAPSCSLLHCPITLANEKQIEPEIRRWLAFADEKLIELRHLRELATGRADFSVLAQNHADIQSRRASPRIHNPAVRKRLESLTEEMFQRRSPFSERQRLQHEKLRLPLFPTTTIGSFPQTPEVRSARARWKRGELSDEQYHAFIKEQIRQCVQFQEDIGIDVPVHGEYERNDMVEYFGEQLEGFLFTENGWVQSYGSRYVKPPIIFGDVSRPHPMTTSWSQYAQSLTRKPMKGMLTGPVTILQWSFVRDDQPRDVTAFQIALAIRDEVLDLEQIGIAAIQIDEPAFREGLPLRRSDWPHYLSWAVRAFRLASSGVRDDTQIHTHMCYSEFNDIIEAIAELDADVITIETSRSNMELLEAFVKFKYPAEIGPGVYDIHSPRVPQVEEMLRLMRKATEVLPVQNLWVNPDCGLKTRRWEEVKPSLRNMVEAAQILRKQFSASNSR